MALNTPSDAPGDPSGGDLTAWFTTQLRATADLIAWAALQIPEERRFARPPRPADAWSAARHLFHIDHYERVVAEPSMRLWLGGPQIDDTRFLNEDAVWAAEGQDQSYEKLLHSFHEARARQIALLPTLAGKWDERRSTVWDVEGLPSPTLTWVVTKTLQHTVDHANELLRMRLYWDVSALRMSHAVAPEPDKRS